MLTRYKGALRPPTLLDDFAAWLASSRYETLQADITLLRYLDNLPRLGGEHALPQLRIRQLGTRLTLQHDGPCARGSIILPNVSMRLQSALVDYTLGKQPERKRELIASAQLNLITPDA